jgi:transposase
VIRIDTLWLCTQPQDMRAGADRLLSIVVNTVGAAHAHHGYLFANHRASRIKLPVHDGFGVWCATRRLHVGRFVWLEHPPAQAPAAATLQLTALQLTAQQFGALAVGLPWQRLVDFSVINRA